MKPTPVAGSLHILRRVATSKGTSRSALILGVTFLVLAVVYVTVSAFTLSSAQQADVQLGRFSNSTYSSVLIGDLPPGFLTSSSVDLRKVVPSAHVLVQTDRLRPDSFAKRFVQAPLDTLQYTEDPELQADFPGRYTLNSGRWPHGPFEVAVSRHVLLGLHGNVRFSVLSGRATLQVVGVLTDAYATTGDVMAGGIGTWEAIPKPLPGHAVALSEASVRVLWNSPGSVEDIGTVMQRLLPAIPKDQGSRIQILVGNASTRAQVSSLPAVVFGADQESIASYLPLALVILLVSALVVGQTRAEYQERSSRLALLGVRGAKIGTIHAAALTSVCAASVTIGLAAGWGLGLLLRLWPLPQYATQPFSPVPAPDLKALALVASSLLLISVGTLRPAWTARSSRTDRSVKIPWSFLRRLAALLGLVVAVKIGSNPKSHNSSVLASYLGIAALLLVTADLLRGTLKLLPTSRARTWVARRLMTSDLGRQGAAATVVACCLALPIAGATQLTSQKVTEQGQRYGLIPAHQIWVQSSGGMGDIAAVGQAVSMTAGVGRPIIARSLAAHAGSAQQVESQAQFASLPTEGNYSNAPIVLESSSELRTILGTLPHGAEVALDSGGVVDFTRAPGPQSFTVFSASGSQTAGSPPLPTFKVQVSTQIGAQLAGAVLLSTAQRYHLPLSAPDRYIFTGVDGNAIANAVVAAVNAGYDAEFVQYAVKPPRPELPTGAYVFLAGLVLGGFSVLLLAVRSQARRLRLYAPRLVALGVTPRWILSVLGLQAASTIGTGLMVGVLAGVAGIALDTITYPTIAVPLLPIALACTATILSAGIASALAVRALSAVENPDVG